MEPWICVNEREWKINHNTWIPQFGNCEKLFLKRTLFSPSHVPQGWIYACFDQNLKTRATLYLTLLAVIKKLKLVKINLKVHKIKNMAKSWSSTHTFCYLQKKYSQIISLILFPLATSKHLTPWGMDSQDLWRWTVMSDTRILAPSPASCVVEPPWIGLVGSAHLTESYMKARTQSVWAEHRSETTSSFDHLDSFTG